MKLVPSVTAALVLLTVLGLGLFGIHRSLWLDEAWVANSILEPTLRGMFFYPNWLQTSPPLFLLLTRAVVWAAGASNFAFRIVPLVMAVAGAALMLAVARRVLAPSLAVLATALVSLDLIAIEYSRTLKPYSGELAASAALLLASASYFEQPDRRRFHWLLATVAIALPLSYPAVFLIPGIVLAVVANGPRARGLWLGASAAAELLAMYLFLIRFNYAPQLRAYWSADVDNRMTVSLGLALAFCIFVAVRAGAGVAGKLPQPRDWTYLTCVLPCLLFAIAAAAGWYPISHRTRLFALPCFVLMAMMTIDELVLARIKAREPVIALLAAALALGLAGFSAANQVFGGRDVPEEDYAAAVAFLKSHVPPADLVLVHACCIEGFRLYAAIDHWEPARLLFGSTGWPCCARGEDARPRISTSEALFADLDAKIPTGYSGRVWLLFTTRPTHWAYTGLDEGELSRKHLWDRGCPPGPYLRFANLAISPMNCVDARK